VIGAAHVVYDRADQLLNGEELGEKHMGIIFDKIESEFGEEKVPKGYTSAQSLRGAILRIKDLPVGTQPVDWPRKRLRLALKQRKSR
jgi:hypothetical protein